jgi:hypothetical protein
VSDDETPKRGDLCWVRREYLMRHGPGSEMVARMDVWDHVPVLVVADGYDDLVARAAPSEGSKQ